MYGCSNKIYLENPFDSTKDFSYSFWQYMISYPYQTFESAIGNSSARYGFEWYYIYPGRSPLYTSQFYYNNRDNYTGYSADLDKEQWVHYEGDYIASSKKFLFFRNGIKIIEINLSTPYNVNYMYVFPGDYKGYVSELLITQYTMHTENFTPPDECYMYPEQHSIADCTENNMYWNK